MTTPHIKATIGTFADTVLFPGDPLRAKFICEKFLENYTEITNVRNMLGFIGTYQGKKVSVMGSGMGIPSCSIYATELYNTYKVKNIIRIGTAGGLPDITKVGDVIIAMGASTNSNVNRTRLMGYDFSATASYELLSKAVESAKRQNKEFRVASCFSEDLFYNPLGEDLHKRMKAMNIPCVEMEAAGLYGVAAEFGGNALAILTISDIIGGASMSSEERQKSTMNMVEIALGCI